MFQPKSAQRTEFEYYMSLPPLERKAMGLGSMRKVCFKVGISYQTGWRWTHKEKVVDNEYEDLMQMLKKTSEKSASAARLYAELQGYLKRDTKERLELSASDFIKIGRETIARLREEYKSSSGSCPVCGQCPLLRHEVCLDTEPEHPADREMATVGIST